MALPQTVTLDDQQKCSPGGGSLSQPRKAQRTSQVAAGNPFPGASDAVVGSANDCATGIVAADNPNYTPVD